MEIRIREDGITGAVVNRLRKKPAVSALAAACLLLGIVFFVSVFGFGRQRAQVPSAGPLAAQGGNKSSPAGPASGLPTGGVNTRQAKMSLEIVPSNAFVNTTLHLAARGFSLPYASVEWTVNGQDRPAVSNGQFDTTGLMAGDKVQAVASINGAVVKSGVLTVSAAPPELKKVRLMPRTFKPGDNLYVEATATGATSIAYEWDVNGNLAGNTSRLATPVRRGDKVTVKITPCNDEGCGQPVVLQNTVGNMPPMFSRRVEASFDGSDYTCQVQATDPDGDALTYSLAKAPAGMSIGPSSGLITWKVPSGGVKAKQNVTVIASDGHGGTSRMTFTIKPQ